MLNFSLLVGRVVNIGRQCTHLMNENGKVPGWVYTNYWIILLPAEVEDSVSEVPFPSMHLNRSYSRNDFIHHHEPFVCENSRFHSQLCSLSRHQHLKGNHNYKERSANESFPANQIPQNKQVDNDFGRRGQYIANTVQRLLDLLCVIGDQVDSVSRQSSFEATTTKWENLQEKKVLLKVAGKNFCYFPRLCWAITSFRYRLILRNHWWKRQWHDISDANYDLLKLNHFTWPFNRL